MLHTETLPPISEMNQTAQYAEIGGRLGGIAIQGEVPVPTDAEIQAGLDLLNAAANGADILPEDTGRIHDIEEAHAKAKIENKIFDIYDEAAQENKIFDAYTEALAENEARKLAIEQLAKQKAETEAEEAAAAKAADVREQAKDALKEAGYLGDIPAGSQIQKDPQTGNILVVKGSDVKVIEKQPNGNPKITEYAYNSSAKTLTIKVQGAHATTVRVGDYVPSKIQEGLQRPEPTSITLPPAVARVVGFKRAVPIPA